MSRSYYGNFYMYRLGRGSGKSLFIETVLINCGGYMQPLNNRHPDIRNSNRILERFILSNYETNMYRRKTN